MMDSFWLLISAMFFGFGIGVAIGARVERQHQARAMGHKALHRPPPDQDTSGTREFPRTMRPSIFSSSTDAACPFCRRAGVAWQEMTDEGLKFAVRCSSCDATTYLKTSIEETGQAWNTGCIISSAKRKAP